jgi:hypothetical protein
MVLVSIHLNQTKGKTKQTEGPPIPCKYCMVSLDTHKDLHSCSCGKTTYKPKGKQKSTDKCGMIYVIIIGKPDNQYCLLVYISL